VVLVLELVLMVVVERPEGGDQHGERVARSRVRIRAARCLGIPKEGGSLRQPELQLLYAWVAVHRRPVGAL